MSLIIKNVHIGQEISNRIHLLGLSRMEFARRIGIYSQHVKTLLSKTSISTDQLAKISEALDFNFFTLYTDIESENNGCLSVVTDYDSAKDECNLAKLKISNEILAEKITMLQNIIEDKNKVIRLLESKMK